jgi:hypothetical protein
MHDVRALPPYVLIEQPPEPEQRQRQDDKPCHQIMKRSASRNSQQSLPAKQRSRQSNEREMVNGGQGAYGFVSVIVDGNTTAANGKTSHIPAMSREVGISCLTKIEERK